MRFSKIRDRIQTSHRIRVARVLCNLGPHLPLGHFLPILGPKLVPFLLVASILSRVIASAQLLACLVDGVSAKKNRNKKTYLQKSSPCCENNMYFASKTSQTHYYQKEIIIIFPHVKAGWLTSFLFVHWQGLHGTPIPAVPPFPPPNPQPSSYNRLVPHCPSIPLYQPWFQSSSSRRCLSAPDFQPFTY